MFRDKLQPNKPNLMLNNFWIDIINDFIKPESVKMQEKTITVNNIFDAIKTR
jgi:hypothetical protein